MFLVKCVSMRRVFFNNLRLRAGWRLILFILLSGSILTVLLIAAIFFTTGKFPLHFEGGMFKVQIKAGPEAIWEVLLYPLISSFILARYIDRRPFRSIGIGFHSRLAKEIFAGIAIGVGMIIVITAFWISLGLFQIKSTPFNHEQALEITGKIASVNAVAGISEEFIYRGYFLQALIEGIGTMPALLVSSTYFAYNHVETHEVEGALIVGCLGLLLAFAYLKTRSLWMPISLHATWNVLVLLIGMDASSPGVILKLQPTGKMSYLETPIIIFVIVLTVAFIWLTKFIHPAPQMEQLWKQFIHPAQPWTHLYVWWQQRQASLKSEN